MGKWFYKVYGLIVESDIEIPELLSIDKNEKKVDVKIKKDIIPKNIIEKIPSYSWFKYDINSMVFTVKGTGSFYIYDGNNIIVQPSENADNQRIKTFILGTSFGMILLQRNKIAIHGGCVLIGENAIILTGQSGAGKSTLTNAFRHYEFPFMADDVCSTVEFQDEIFIEPAYPQQKICKDAMKKIGYNISNFKLIDEEREKYIIPTHESFVKEKRKLKAIFEIEPYDGEEVKIEEVSGGEKMKIILRNIYRIEVIAPFGIPKSYFKKVINIAKNTLVFRIKRPRDQFSVDRQIELIERELMLKGNV
ncbi:ATP-binding cassette domain-containing protein [Clostridium perfringens]|uniref:ATP-binding cassette domain-containing protein n=1 Tax=Clostridium perfringens TaxID=1502 RepID=UPI000E16AB95|nr:ATP-binding cassette domain-containing protein [Clostridium perfringens]SUY29939.1 putative bacteriocin export ABC transporter, lactococcin 972 group [Clostridium perfringens]